MTSSHVKGLEVVSAAANHNKQLNFVPSSDRQGAILFAEKSVFAASVQ